MEEIQIRKISVALLLLLVVSLGGHFWQYRHNQNATLDYRKTISELREDNLTQETEIEMYLAFIQNLEERITPDVVRSERQQDVIRRFILSYYTFVSGEEEIRIENSAEFVTDEMLGLMRDALVDDPGGSYHLSLTASNINVYIGSTNEFIATFNVAYESDMTRSMTQILVVRFIMNEEQIREFVIISASEVFNFD